MNGLDDESNMIVLLAEEHFVAHQLLCKIYNNSGLTFAAMKMTMSSGNQQRSNNKMYSWLRKKYSNQQKGKKLSEEHKKKIGLAFKGKKLSDAHKQKIRDSKKHISQKTRNSENVLTLGT